MKTIHTIIIGAGQAGLSTSYFLAQKDIDHVVLEKGTIANEWKTRRWDAFHLITPNHMTRLPGFSYEGNNPNGFDSRDEVVSFLESYAKSFNAPVIENTTVLSVTKDNDTFLVKTHNEDYEAKNVIVAVGSFHKPLIPSLSQKVNKNITQIHSSQYKNSEQLSEGAVLIVGGGNSGIQIATDLNKAGREVYLSLGRLRIVPRNYRGKDFMEWAEIMGALDKATEEATPETKATLPPLLFGNSETVILRKIGKDGVHLLGRLIDIENEIYHFDNSLVENVEKAETGLEKFKETVDSIIEAKQIDASTSEQEEQVDYDIPVIETMNEKNISTIIWATGFVDDWSFLHVPEAFEKEQPLHTKGVSKVPGLYFMGLRWQSKYKSFLLCGVAEDAEYIASNTM